MYSKEMKEKVGMEKIKGLSVRVFYKFGMENALGQHTLLIFAVR